MSKEHESENLSPSILHFINKSNKTEVPSNPDDETDLTPATTDVSKTELSAVQENNTQQSTKNENTEKPITTVSHSRRVHFPADDSQLRVISNAPEPLSSRPLLSLGAILQRYRGTCQRLQIRPLNCLLDQLSTMDDGRKSFYDRLDCLKIVNEKIDLKQIDAIEEILSRCRFHTLNLESSTIDESALVELFDVIEYYESCTHINLSSNRSVSFQGYQALTKYLRKTNCLERLDANSMRFDDSNIVTFTRSLRLSTTLSELHVESCQLNGKILQKFIENIRSCSCLRELYLCDNRLQVQDSILLNNLIRTCSQFLNLLDLRSNSLQDNGMSHLASQFSQYDEHHTNGVSLHKISFQANQLTHLGVGFLAKSLLHNRTLHSLNLSNNNITNEGLFLLRDALLTNRTINELILRNCRLTDQSAIALAEFIAESSTIQYIDLRENAIQASGICGMAIAIKNNKSLLKLDFDPIISTPTNSSSSGNTNNIDRTTNTNSLLSLSNLRRMTTSFTSSTPSQPTASGSGGGTRELLEQKARWMNDIAAVCQRNILIHEEKLRTQGEEQNSATVNGADETNQTNSVITKPEDIEFKEQTLDTNRLEDNTLSVTTDSTSPASIIPNNNEEILQSIDTATNETNTKDNALDDNTEIEPSLNASVSVHNQDEQAMNTPTSDHNEVEQPTLTSIDDTAEIKQFTDIPTDNETDLEQPTTDPAESIPSGDNPDEFPSNLPDQNSTSRPDLPDSIHDGGERKFRHSDSIYLLRQKVKNENDDDTSDDESQLSSTDEQIVDGE